MSEREFEIGQRVHIGKDSDVYIVVNIDGVLDTEFEGPKPYRLALEHSQSEDVTLILAGQSTDHIRPAAD